MLLGRGSLDGARLALHAAQQLDDAQPDRTLSAAAKLREGQLAQFFLLAPVMVMFCADCCVRYLLIAAHPSESLHHSQ